MLSTLNTRRDDGTRWVNDPVAIVNSMAETSEPEVWGMLRRVRPRHLASPQLLHDGPRRMAHSGGRSTDVPTRVPRVSTPTALKCW